MNYSIIKDKSEFQKFINWLPDLAENERYYVSLLARKKYEASVPNNNQQLNRFLSRKEDIYHKVLQLECPIGAYKMKGNVDVPQEALALYICINPRSLSRGLKVATKSLVDILVRGDQVPNPARIALNAVKVCCSRKNYIVFDIDDKNPELIEKAFYTLGERCPYIETRGGYHLLIDGRYTSEFKDKMWYKKIAECADVPGDEMSPVPGCTQGSFAPRLFLP